MQRSMTFVVLSSTGVAILAIGILFILPSQPVKGVQATIESRISVDESRPLAKAAEVLQLRTGESISYEDPPWVFSDDVVRAADTPWGADIIKTHPNFNAVVPKVARLDVSLPADRVTRRLAISPAAALERINRDHSDRNNPGVFRVQALEDGFVIIPVRARDAAGRVVEVRSPLDFPIYFEEGKRSGADTLNTIFEAVSKGSGYRVEVGLLPNHLTETMVSLGAKGDIARDVLIKFLKTDQWSDPRNRGVIPKMSWRLLFEPKDKYFIFSLVPLRREELDPSGRSQSVPVPR